MTRNLPYTAGLLVVVSAFSVCAAQAAPAKSSIESVTLYRGQALVTRTVALPAKQGEQEIVVSDLPAQVVGASLHADGDKGVTVRSVRYRTRAVAVEPKKEVAELDAQIKQVGREIAANQEMMDLLGKKARLVEKLESFTAATAKDDAARGKLDVKTVGEMTDVIFKHHAEYAKENIVLKFKDQDLKEQLDLLKRKRAELTREKNRTVREAVVRVTAPGPGAANLHLSYLVSSAGWTPTYNIRLDADGKSVTIEYLAEAWQKSGEDWSSVALTLSTATPQMNARSPLLSPYWISLQGDGKKTSALKSFDSFNKAQIANAEDQLGILTAWANPTGREQMLQAGWRLNHLAAQAQSMELNVKGDVFRAGPVARIAAEGLAVSYPLGGKMTLTSRSDKQLVQIQKVKLPAECYHVAVPLLSTYVFRAARATNTSALPLLSGPYNAYIGGEFVGRANLPLVARGQPLNLGFGVDTQLRCRRELLDKSDRTSWGSRIQNFNYRLRLESYKDKPVKVRLVDRIPATKTDDIDIELGDLSHKLSTDAVYVRDLRPRGILRWELELAAGASGTKARDVTYEFEMKFAKDKHLGRHAAGLIQKMRIDYDEMMMMH